MKWIAVVSLASLSGCFSVNLDVGAAKHAHYTEKAVLEDPSATDKVALIDVEGVISEDSPQGLLSSRDSAVVATLEKLKKAKADPDVKAVILRMDTPGGSVTASDTIYHELLRFKEEKKVPVVASFLSVSASGGYYISCACDRIVAEPTAITGSIGVIALRVSLAGLLEKLGIQVDAVKSGLNKDMGSPFRGETQEERQLLQGLIDDMYARFIRVVAEGRKAVLSEERVRQLADGRVYTADKALAEHLIDRIGYVQDAFGEVKAMANLKAARLVMYSRQPSSIQNVYSPGDSSGALAGGSTPTEERLRNLLGFRMYYLWEPDIAGR